METINDFARSLSLLRREKGVSQRAAARDLGVSQALLSHYENGVREPGLAFVRRACDYYRVSSDFLLGRSMSREGITIDASELHDESVQHDHVLRGSIMGTLHKKLIINSVSILFDLLGKSGGKESIQAASDYLSTAVYKLFRHLYRASGTQDEGFFSIPASHFLTGFVNADMICSESEYATALADQVKARGKDSFPAMNNDALAKAFPGSYQSLLQIIHTTARRVNHNTESRWTAKDSK